ALSGLRVRTRFFRKGASPMKHDQFTLPFLDTTSLAGGLGLYSGFPTAGFPTAKSPTLPEMTFEPEKAEVVEAPAPRSRPSPPTTTASPAIAVSPRAGRRALETIWPRSGA